MSKNFEKVKQYYTNGLWSEQKVYNMVAKGILTKEEYRLIVGKDYK